MGFGLPKEYFLYIKLIVTHVVWAVKVLIAIAMHV